jgi:hypothetical protein
MNIDSIQNAHLLFWSRLKSESTRFILGHLHLSVNASAGKPLERLEFDPLQTQAV